MSSAPSLASRTRREAAKRLLAASSVAPVASGDGSGWEGMEAQQEVAKRAPASAACFSPAENTVYSRGGP
jgi:hypothetical protein